MTRLIHYALAALLVSAAGPCFGQAIGEMVQLGSHTPQPVKPGTVMPGGPQSTTERAHISKGAKVTVAKGSYHLPARTANTKNQPAFTVYNNGDASSDADDKTDASAGQAQQSQASPAKPNAAPPPKQKDLPSPPSQ